MKRGYVIVLLIVIMAISTAQANWTEPFTNGSFSEPLSIRWTNYSNVGIVSGQAVMQERQDGIPFLEQYFTLSDNTTNLSFQYLALFDNGPSDTFSVSLMNSSYNPLIDTNSNPFDPSESYFFMHDSSGGLYQDSGYVKTRSIGSGWLQVDVDLTSLAGSSYNAILSFDLIGNFTAPFDSRILLDNILLSSPIQVIPAPGAMILALVGLLSAGVFKRFRN